MFNKTSRILIVVAVLGVILAMVQKKAVTAGSDRLRGELELCEEVGLCLKETEEAFNGRLVEHYPDGSLKIAIEISRGRTHGRSRGWYENGQLEVEEYFVDGVSHGTRTRWYENGAKKSEAEIADGKIEGLYRQWYEDGSPAAEVKMLAGHPTGEGRSWDRPGSVRNVTVNGGSHEKS